MTPMNNAVFLLDVDNKLRILAAMKKTWGDRLTTVFPRQAADAKPMYVTAQT